MGDHIDSVANRTTLVVFSDDWGRHPSSCQHLVHRLLPRYRTLWVNTIGTRRPRLTREDLGKALTKLTDWVRPNSRTPAADRPHVAGANHGADGPEVIGPVMWPGFRRAWQQRLNAGLVSRAVNRALGPRQRGETRVAVATVPIAADLVGRIDVDRWVYYCPDDFSVWPGLDGRVMRTLERRLVSRVDQVVAVSEELRSRLSRLGRGIELLSHGIDLHLWGNAEVSRGRAGLPAWAACARPRMVFWGLIDRRLDTEWCRAVADGVGGIGTLVLIGPKQSPDPAVTSLARVVMPGPVRYGDLPQVAAAADVLVMPYADLPVTRAMQPLKFKEYLATGKPVVARDLPATRPWADAADVVSSVAEFAQRVRERGESGLPPHQRVARRRLALESWDEKARRFEAMLLGKAA